MFELLKAHTLDELVEVGGLVEKLEHAPLTLPEGLASADASGSYHAYSVTVDGAENLRSGAYTTTLQVTAYEGATAQPVPVEVRVRLNLLWPIGTVLLGVLAARLLLFWKEGARRIRWDDIRARWIDLASEDTDWTTEVDAPQWVLDEIKAELRLEVKKVRDWLQAGRAGKKTIGDMPTTLELARAIVFPLQAAAWRYVEDPSQLRLESLVAALVKLAQAAEVQASGSLKDAAATAKSAYDQLREKGMVHTPFTALKDQWESPIPPKGTVVKAAWTAIQASWKAAKELLVAFDNLRQQISKTTLPLPVAEGVTQLISNLNSFQDKVITVALEQQKAMKTEPQPEEKTMDVLEKLVELGSSVGSALEEAIAAQQPLKNFAPASPVAISLLLVESGLGDAERVIGNLGKKYKVSPQAVPEKMLQPVTKPLQNADAKMWDAKTKLDEVWPQLCLDFGQSRSFVGAGRHLRSVLDRCKSNDLKDLMEKITPYTDAAYRHLLKGEGLLAEIQLERAESVIMAELSAWDRFAEAVKALWARVARRLRPVFSPLVRRWEQSEMRPDANIYESVWKRIRGTQPDAKLLQELQTAGILDRKYCIDLIGKEIVEQQIRERWRYIMSQAWVVAAIIGILLAAVVMTLMLRDHVGRIILGVVVGLPALGWILRIAGLDILLQEIWENLRPMVIYLGGALVDRAVSIVVAVFLLLLANRLIETADTWGTPFDFAQAFIWGVFADRATEPIESVVNQVKNWLKPEPEKEAEEPAKKTDEESEQKAAQGKDEGQGSE